MSKRPGLFERTTKMEFTEFAACLVVASMPVGFLFLAAMTSTPVKKPDQNSYLIPKPEELRSHTLVVK